MYRSMIINRMIMIDSGCDKNVKSIMLLFYFIIGLRSMSSSSLSSRKV